ncbi:MAG TPA: NCS2 family permease [Candidatus Limnocylindrales bacterium]|nr:NCS2 family permease [Candidatus Limnocylindrales bacterium]
MEAVASYFRLRERGVTFGTEVRAGLTTFMVMAYIIFVNPQILAGGPLGPVDQGGTGLGPPFLAVAVATALAAGILTIAMGLATNYPFALAAGLGLNAVVAFELILGRGLAWQDAMAVIVWEGIIITILVLTGLREAVMNAIPLNLKRAIAVGIGLFILFIGLVNGGFVTVGPGVPPVVPGDIVNVATLTFVIGLGIALALMARRVRGALLLTIVLTTIIAIVLNMLVGPANSGFLPNTAVLPDTLQGYIFNFELENFQTIFQPLMPEHLLGVWTNYNFLIIALVVFTLMMADFFDTMGTVVGVGEQAGFIDNQGRLPGIRNVLLVDSLGAVTGGAFGVSSNTTYIESAAGVAEGGRTGLTSVVVGLLFILAILFAPIAGIVPAQATAPVLVVVGFLMFTIAREFDWGSDAPPTSGPAEGEQHDLRAPQPDTRTEPRIDVIFPVLATLIVMPLTFTITDGIAAGFVTYAFLKLVTGRWREVHPLMWAVSIAFVLFFAVPWLETFL